MYSNIKTYLGITRQMAGAWIKRYYRFTTIGNENKTGLLKRLSVLQEVGLAFGESHLAYIHIGLASSL